ncbi:MAG: hypothetical protein AMJ78_00405 [Omnitrophica WOR_2 bacterium SM23_29]|nr:MAG: hypothetical protein AMJ78_00405 [Omnitrophica WOR_2 bacterium SM23_29]
MRFCVIGLLDFYQQYISKNLPISCRFYPSCSEYAKQAILKYGTALGMAKAIWRLVKCHPFSGTQGFCPLK